MEENTEQNNGDVSKEEVDKVIAKNAGETKSNEESNGEYKDLSNEEAKDEEKFQEELENPSEQPSTEVPEITPPENSGGQSGTDQLTQQPPQEASPTEEGISMKLLQFQCENCEFKIYANLDDDKLGELPAKVKCLNCGKKKSVKNRIMDSTLHGYVDYVEPVDTTKPTEATKE